MTSPSNWNNNVCTRFHGKSLPAGIIHDEGGVGHDWYMYFVWMGPSAHFRIKMLMMQDSG